GEANSAISPSSGTSKVECQMRAAAANTKAVRCAKTGLVVSGNRPCAAAKLWQHASVVARRNCEKQQRPSGERREMSVRHILFVAVAGSIGTLAMSPASSQTLRYANQGELKSLDPYTLKETTTIAHLGHAYEGLVTRDKDLKIIPALAESWETPEPTRWRFHLRKGVKFHNGDPFTADDVLFSAQRVRAPGSNFLSNVPADAKFIKVDDYTVDVKLDSPNPILTAQWDAWF